MFGAGLSKVAQRKADKKNVAGPKGGSASPAKQSSKSANASEFDFLVLKDDVQALSMGVDDITVEDKDDSEASVKTKKRLPEGALPIVYSDEKQVPKELLLEFFKAGSKMLMSEQNIREIVNESGANNVPLYIQSMNFQKDVLERNFQIEREYGCKQLSLVSMYHPDDDELKDAAVDFMLSAMESYMEQVKYRARQRFTKIRQNTGKDAVLRSTGGMSKQDYMEFFEVVCSTVCLPQARAVFKAEFEKSKKFDLVAAVSVKMQHRLLELMGVEWQYGVDCLNKIGILYTNDRELSMKFMTFQVSTELYCRLACMTEGEEEAFLKEVPENSKKMPHLYFARKQMAMSKGGGPGGPGSQPMARPDPSQLPEDQRRLYDRLSSEEGSKKVTALFERVNAVKDQIISNIETMDEAARKAYFEDFAKEDVAKSVGDIKQESAYEGLEAFIDMPEEDLRKVLTMNAVFNADTRAGGTMMKRMGDHAHVKGAMVQFSNTIRLVSTSIMQAQQQMAAQQQRMQQQEQGQGQGTGPQQQSGGMPPQPPQERAPQHGAHNPHAHGVAREAPKPDLASGDSMDR